jgi:hypothetical protein
LFVARSSSSVSFAFGDVPLMKLSPQQSYSPARVGILWFSAGWLLFFSAWMFLLWSNGRGLPGLHGPGSLGNFMRVVLACFAGTAITAIIAAATTLAKFGRLSPLLRIIGLAPATCMVLVYIVLCARE